MIYDSSPREFEQHSVGFFCLCFPLDFQPVLDRSSSVSDTEVPTDTDLDSSRNAFWPALKWPEISTARSAFVYGLSCAKSCASWYDKWASIFFKLQWQCSNYPNWCKIFFNIHWGKEPLSWILAARKIIRCLQCLKWGTLQMWGYIFIADVGTEEEVSCPDCRCVFNGFCRDIQRIVWMDG